MKVKLLAGIVLALICYQSFGQSKVEKKKIKRAIEQHDHAIQIREDWVRDPYIKLFNDGYYYLTGSMPVPNDPREKSDPYNVGLDNVRNTVLKTPSIIGHKLRVWRSKDLVSWKYLGEPFSLEKGYWQTVSPEAFTKTPQQEWKLWAPEIFKEGDRWLYIHTSPGPVRGGANLAITEGDDMTGPFTFPLGKVMKGKHDPSLFKDDDGTWYLLYGNTKIAPIKKGFTGLAAEPVRIDPSDRKIGHEGATLRKIGNKYVHFGTAWSTDQMRKGSYNLYYSLSDNVMGPYGPRRFVGRFLGHGTPFIDKEGRWWCTAFFNGNVPPLDSNGIEKKDLGETAQTINPQGTTLVPLEVKILEDGDVYIRAKDPRYASPGPDEAQQFE